MVGDGVAAGVQQIFFHQICAAPGHSESTASGSDSVKAVRNAKKAIRKAFQNQIDGKGFSLVEVLSSCPTNWGMTPKAALQWIDDKMIPYYPLGVYKDRSAQEAK